MVLIISALLLLIVAGWLLISPIQLQINSQTQVYMVHWRGIGTVRLLPPTDDLVIQLRILFWKWHFHPLRYQPKKEKPKKAQRKSRKVNFRKYQRKGLKLLRSFQIRAFRLDLDTDDYICNSYLYPLFHLFSTNKRQLTINYKGELTFLLVVENRLYRLLGALLF